MPHPLTPALPLDAMAHSVHAAGADMGRWLLGGVAGPALLAVPTALAALVALALVQGRRPGIAEAPEVALQPAQPGPGRITDACREAQAALAMMAALQEQARQIHGITDVIDRIATQTQFLALNAGIEAARAGERGHGFAAVAGALRQLAQRTKASNDDIGQMVRALREQTDRAAAGVVALSGKVGEAAGNVERAYAVLGDIHPG